MVVITAELARMQKATHSRPHVTSAQPVRLCRQNQGWRSRELLKGIKCSREDLHLDEVLRDSSGGLYMALTAYRESKGIEYLSYEIYLLNSHENSYKVDSIFLLTTLFNR